MARDIILRNIAKLTVRARSIRWSGSIRHKSDVLKDALWIIYYSALRAVEFVFLKRHLEMHFDSESDLFPPGRQHDPTDLITWRLSIINIAAYFRTLWLRKGWKRHYITTNDGRLIYLLYPPFSKFASSWHPQMSYSQDKRNIEQWISEISW